MITIALSVNSLHNVLIANSGLMILLFCNHYEVLGLTQIIDTSGNEVTGKLSENFEDPIYSKLSGLSPVMIELNEDYTYSL